MFQLPNRKINHQQQQLDHYAYQNQLLSQRNQLLSQQNQRLLEELEKSHMKLEEKDVLKAGAIIEECKGIRKVAERDLVRIKRNLGKEGKKIVDPLLQLINHEKQSEDIMTIFTGLLEIINKLSEKYTNIKHEKVKNHLSQMEDRLAVRKTARNKTQRVFHVVKEPNQSLLGWNPKLISQELTHQRSFFEKIIRKVRRQDISMRELQNIYNKLDDSNRLRWSLKSQQTQLTLLERQFQLGSIQPTALEHTVRRISQLSNELSVLRSQLDNAVSLL